MASFLSKNQNFRDDVGEKKEKKGRILETYIDVSKLYEIKTDLPVTGPGRQL